MGEKEIWCIEQLLQLVVRSVGDKIVSNFSCLGGLCLDKRKQTGGKKRPLGARFSEGERREGALSLSLRLRLCLTAHA